MKEALAAKRAVGPAQSLPAIEFEARLRKLRQTLRRERLDGAVISGAIARLYYTGLAASNGVLWVDAREEPLFLTDFRYIVTARRTMPFLRSALLPSGTKGVRELRKQSARWRRCGYEGAHPTKLLQSRGELFEKVDDWLALDENIAAQRAIKSAREQRAMRRVIAANDAMLAALVPQLCEGLSEWDIRNLLRREMDLCGQGEAFDSIVAIGANGAECHHTPDLTLLRRNQSLLLDFGLKLDHYCSDLTRCVAFGRTSKLFKELHRLVLEANRRAIAAIKPGMACNDIDAIARDFLTKAGYGKAFGHGLGHGLGIEVHETPAFNARCKTKLVAGMILTVEPGIYLPGRAGVRLEDVVLIKRNGCEVLTSSPHWIEHSVQ